MTNPDMLHASILPGHARWADFLLRLVAGGGGRGARRRAGSSARTSRWSSGGSAGWSRTTAGTPQFVLASATIGNPAELAERLAGLPFDEVADDASPRGEKLFVLWNPPMVDEELGLRRSAVSETAWLLWPSWSRPRTRTIAFCRTRRAAELVAEFARRELPGVAQAPREGVPGRLPARGAPGARAGARRRRAPRRGRHERAGARASTSGRWTPALLAGYPGTRASMWQQAGRAGRRREASLADPGGPGRPAGPVPGRHPGDLFDKPPEAAVIDPTNPYVLEPHLACAAREQPPGRGRAGGLRADGAEARPWRLESTRASWSRRRGLLHHRGRESPHARVDIRSASGAPVRHRRRGDRRAARGPSDEARAFCHVHPGAIYLHQGEQFEVRDARPRRTRGAGRTQRRRLLHAGPRRHRHRGRRRARRGPRSARSPRGRSARSG